MASIKNCFLKTARPKETPPQNLGPRATIILRGAVHTVSHSLWNAKGFTGKPQFVPPPWGHYCPCFAEQRFAGTDCHAQSQRASKQAAPRFKPGPRRLRSKPCTLVRERIMKDHHWFSIFLTLRPFIAVPHAVLTQP